MNKNLEFWRKIGLSFEILGVLAKLSFDENVEKKKPAVATVAKVVWLELLRSFSTSVALLA